MLPNERTTRSEVVSLPSEIEVLVAAPERNLARPLVSFLKAERVNVQLVGDADTAFEEAILHLPNVVLVDDRIPPAGGVEFCQRLKGNSRTHFVPAILVTPEREAGLRARAFQAGADAVFDPSTDEGEQRARLWALIRSQALYRRQQRKQTTQGHALQSRRRWVSNFVHDLQSSLGALQANFEYMTQAVLAREARSNAELDECLRDAQSLFAQMARGLRTVLDFERFESGRIVVREAAVRLSELAEETRRELEWQAVTERKALTVHLASAEPPLRGDRNLLKEAVQNVMGFALRQPGTRQVETRLETVAGAVELRVMWDGEGIAADDRVGLFEPYGRGAGGQGAPVGHGLGLALARVVAEVHGGSVWVEDAPEGRSQLVLQLKLGLDAPEVRDVG